MTKKIMASIFLFSSVSQADVIKCSFGEPSVETTYSMVQSTLTSKDSDGKVRIVKNVSFQIKAPGVFELVASNGKILQKLFLNYKGSDGVDGDTERIYPYEVVDSSLLRSANKGIGGCVSNSLKLKTQ